MPGHSFRRPSSSSRGSAFCLFQALVFARGLWNQLGMRSARGLIWPASSSSCRRRAVNLRCQDHRGGGDSSNPWVQRSQLGGTYARSAGGLPQSLREEAALFVRTGLEATPASNPARFLACCRASRCCSDQIQLFVSNSPSPPAPGTMYCVALSPRSCSGWAPGMLASASFEDRPRSNLAV